MADGLPFLRLMMYTIKTAMMISTTSTATITPTINPPLGPAVLASWFPEKSDLRLSLRINTLWADEQII